MNKQLTNYIRSGKAGLMVVSYEEQRVESELKRIAEHLEWRLHSWTITDGLVCLSDNPPTVIAETDDPMGMLSAFEKLQERVVVIAKDFHCLLKDPNPVLVRKLKDVLAAAQTQNKTFVIVGCAAVIPDEVSKEIALVEFKLPSREQLKVVLDGIAKSAGLEVGNNGEVENLLDAASGLTTTEASDAFALSVVECNEIRPEIVFAEKAMTLKKGGILEVIKSDITFADLGGLDELKAWVRRRTKAFTKEARAYHLPTPKGICLFGVQGCGKSYATKAIANEIGVPLIKLDAGKLFGGLVGQSEATTRAVIEQVEAFGKCVLQIEELDKSFAGMKASHDGDSGTTRRVVGTFLTWMQEKTSPVFIVATANDLTKLPAELLRKGRWDELIFLDLPTESERVEIWRVQIRRHHRDPKDFDLLALAKMTDTWSGAEIEALFGESLYSAFDEKREPDTESIIALSRETVPLSKMMASDIEALRQWSNGRAKRASKPQAVQVVKGGQRKLAKND